MASFIWITMLCTMIDPICPSRLIPHSTMIGLAKRPKKWKIDPLVGLLLLGCLTNGP
jgi:hypothetical protein